MDTARSATPTLAAVRLARAQRDAVMRRLRPVSLVILALVLVIGVRQQPHPGLHGEPLAVLIALAAVEIGAVAALWMPREAGWLLVVPFVPLAVGSVVLAWLQRGTAGSLGFLILALAVMRIHPQAP